MRTTHIHQQTNTGRFAHIHTQSESGKLLIDCNHATIAVGFSCTWNLCTDLLFIYLFILVTMLIKEKDQQRDLVFYQGLILLLECSEFLLQICVKLGNSIVFNVTSTKRQPL